MDKLESISFYSRDLKAAEDTLALTSWVYGRTIDEVKHKWVDLSPYTVFTKVTFKLFF